MGTVNKFEGGPEHGYGYIVIGGLHPFEFTTSGQYASSIGRPKDPNIVLRCEMWLWSGKQLRKGKTRAVANKAPPTSSKVG